MQAACPHFRCCHKWHSPDSGPGTWIFSRGLSRRAVFGPDSSCQVSQTRIVRYAEVTLPFRKTTPNQPTPCPRRVTPGVLCTPQPCWSPISPPPSQRSTSRCLCSQQWVTAVMAPSPLPAPPQEHGRPALSGAISQVDTDYLPG